MFPVLDLEGAPFARGLAYGRAAREQIVGSVRCYAAMFASCGIDWIEAQRRAADYRPVIEQCGGGLLEEMTGIAAGSDRHLHEILALNCRTEILPPSFLGMEYADSSAAKARNAALGLFDIGECTSLAVSGTRCIDGHTRVAQNWDWVGYQRQNVLALRVHRADLPDYLTLTEAGIVAKIGINEAGLAIGLNILRAVNDREVPGVPVHVFQRMALDCADVAAVIALARELRFAASSNAILGDVSGAVAALEYSPNGSVALAPTHGVVTHTNHFCDAALAARQAPLTQMLTTGPRLHCAQRHVARWPGQIADDHLCALLRDESGDGVCEGVDAKCGAICRHPDPASPPELRVESIFGVIIDCNARRMRVAPDIPSRVAFEAVALAGTGDAD